MNIFEAPAFKTLKSAGLAAAIFGALILCAESAIAGNRTLGPVPEIDPGSLTSAIALVLGGTAVLRGRIRR